MTVTDVLDPTATRPSYPLSLAQQRLVFIHEAGSGDNGYLFPVNLRLRGPLDADALGTALRRILDRHEVLRSRVVLEASGARQEAGPVFDPVVVEDLAGAPDPEAAALDRVDEEATAAFDLEHRLLRVRLLRLGADDHVLLVSVHHVAFDGWSCQIFLRELGELYSAAVEGRTAELAPVPTSYGELAARERARTDAPAGPAAEFWATQTADLPGDLPLPSDRPRPEAPTGAMGRLWRALGQERTAAVGAAARQHRVTVHMLLLAAFEATLSVASGRTDFFVGGATSGRSDPETHAVVGLFVNDVPYRSDVTPGCCLADLVAAVKARSLAVLRHQDHPFDRIVQGAAPRRTLDRHPLFQHALTLQPREDGDAGLAMAGLTVTAFPTRAEGSALDLTFSLHHEADGLHLAVDHSTDLWDAESMGVLADNFLRVLDAVPERDRVPLDDLGLDPLPCTGSGYRSAETAGPVPADAPTPAAPGEADRGPGDAAGSGGGAGETLRTVSDVFAELLGRAAAPDTDFFGAGGDSIGAMRAVARLRALTGRTVGVRDLFRSPTPAGLAARIDARGSAQAEPAAAPVPAAEPDGPSVPVLPMQSWLAGTGPVPDAYGFSAMVRSEEAVQPRLLKRAVAVTLKRHDATRWRFRRTGDGLEAEVLEGPGHGPLEVVDLQDVAPQEAEAAVAEHAAEVQRALVVDGEGPLVRVVLYLLPDGTSRVLVAACHLVMDVVSMHVVVEDTLMAYDALVRHEPIDPLPASAGSADWSRALRRWAHGEDAAEAAEGWRLVEASYPADLPMDHEDGADAVEHERTTSYRLTREETAALRAAVRGLVGVDLEHVLLWATGGALGGLVGGRGVVLDLESHGRVDDLLLDPAGRPLDASRTVGWLTAIHPFALPTGAVADAPGGLRLVAQLARSVPHLGLTYGALAANGRLEWRVRDVAFSFMGSVESASMGEGRGYATLDPAPARHPRMRRRHRLEVDALVADGVLRVSLTHSAAQLDLATVDAVGAAVLDRLREVASGDR